MGAYLGAETDACASPVRTYVDRSIDRVRSRVRCEVPGTKPETRKTSRALAQPPKTSLESAVRCVCERVRGSSVALAYGEGGKRYRSAPAGSAIRRRRFAARQLADKASGLRVRSIRVDGASEDAE